MAVRYGRMLRSPFAFFRGAAAIMAADLAPGPSTTVTTQLCGDAHLSNFGTFAGPDRRLVFDLNDFDESLPGPFEWDVKRLVASVEVAGRHRGFPPAVRRKAVRAAARRYRETVLELAALPTLAVWYSRLDVDDLLEQLRQSASASEARALEGRIAKTREKDSLRALQRLTHVADGRRRFLHDPPLLVPLEKLLPEDEQEQLQALMHGWLRGYRASLSAAQRTLLDRFALTDVAHKVVGVGSVGARAWVALLLGRDERDVLVLQLKEAQPSVLEGHLPRSVYRQHGRRVVEGQRLMQAASDRFLGWVSGPGADGVRRDFYVRQIWDAKGSVDVERIRADRFGTYAELCAAALGRAHARAGDPVAIAAYLGRGESFDRAMQSFAGRYADQNDADYAALEAAADAGRIPAADGP